jgi:hypothetical protein
MLSGQLVEILHSEIKPGRVCKYIPSITDVRKTKRRSYELARINSVIKYERFG